MERGPLLYSDETTGSLQTVPLLNCPNPSTLGDSTPIDRYYCVDLIKDFVYLVNDLRTVAYSTSSKSVPWISALMPVNFFLMASFDDA